MPWDIELQNRYRQWKEALRDLQYDFQKMVEEVNNKGEIDLQMTRHILSHLPIKYPRGLTDVISVAAYQSETDFLTDFNFSMILPNFSYNPIQPAFSNMGLLLGQKILFPYDIDVEKALEKAINLARKDDFKKKRRGLYDRQEEVIRTGKPLEEALHKFNSLINDYNIHVKDECLKDRVVNFLEGFSYVVSPIAAEVSKALVEGNPGRLSEQVSHHDRCVSDLDLNTQRDSNQVICK